MVRWSEGGEQGAGSSADPSSQEKDPVELIHKQQAGARAPPDVHLRVLAAAPVLDPELTIDTRAAEMDQIDSQGT